MIACQVAEMSREQIVSSLGLPEYGFNDAHRTIAMLVAERAESELQPLLEQYGNRVMHDLFQLSAAAQDFVRENGADLPHAHLPPLLPALEMVSCNAFGGGGLHGRA